MKNLNKHLSLLIFFVLVSCSEVAPKLPNPSITALAYVKNLNNQDFSSAYDLLSKVDKSVLTKNDYLEFKKPEVMLEVGKAIALQSEYKIKETSAIDTSANVIIEISSPDYTFLFQKMLSSVFTNAFNTKSGDEYLEDLSEDIEKILEAGDVPIQITDQQVQLILEDNEWRVLEGLKVAYQESMNRQKVNELLSDAASLEKKKKYKESIDAYKEVLSIDNSNSKAISSIEEIEDKLAEQKMKRDYFDKVEIFDFEATRIDTYLDKNIPAVRFAIRNRGDRSLDKVEVTVYFYDRNKNAIFEKTYYPVLVSSYGLNNNSPLKPNYIKRQKENNYYTIDELGSEWAGKADAIVSDIEFSEEM